MHNYILCPFHLKRFLEILMCGLRGIAMTRNRTDGRTDRSKTLYPPKPCCMGYKKKLSIGEI